MLAGELGTSLVSCFLLLDRQAGACLRGLLALDLLATASVGERPHRERQRRAKCKSAAHVEREKFVENL
jgi:hypothetical protein